MDDSEEPKWISLLKDNNSEANQFPRLQISKHLLVLVPNIEVNEALHPNLNKYVCKRSDNSEYSRSQSLNSDILFLGPKDSSHCVHQQLLLLANHLPVHQLHVCVLVIQQLHQILFQPEPGPNPETCAVDVQLG